MISRHTKLILTTILSVMVICSCEKSEEPPYIKEKGRFIDEWTYDVDTDSPSSKNVYKMWISEGIEPKGILVLSVGGLGNGINMVNHDEWQNYAVQEELALVGTQTDADVVSSAQNLRTAVKEIAERHNMASLISLPYLLRGHSSGGRFSYVFAQTYPRSTLAWANIKGSMSTSDTELPSGLYITGEKDLESRNSSIHSAFLAQRAIGGIALYAQEYDAGHGAGASDDLVRAFFSAMLTHGLDDRQAITPIDTSAIYLGNNETLEVAPYAEYQGEKSLASCIVDTGIVAIWRDFQSDL